MQQTLENMVATRHWVAQLLGSWNQDDVIVETVGKHHLPGEVLAGVPKAWENAMKEVGKEIGAEGIDWRIVAAEPYAKMEVPRGDTWGVRMFAGDQTRIESYSIADGKLKLVHSPANYAESLATNNTDPWGLINDYGGRIALADGHAVSVTITAVDENGKEVIQLFKRGKGLGEYGGYIGTAAGNSLRTDMTPFDIAYRESSEESRILPFVSAYMAGYSESGILPALTNQEEYRRLGLATSEFEVVEELTGGKKVRFLDRRGNEAYGTLVSHDTQFRMTGLALNIDPDDKTPHHKSEYLFLARTTLPLEAVNDEQFGWVRNDERADAFYIRVDELADFAVEQFMEMMPPTNAVLLSALRAIHGSQAFETIREAINTRYPIDDDHPLVQVVRQGHYTLPDLITQ